MRYFLAAVDFFKGHEGPLMLCNDRGFCREFIPPPDFFLDLSRWFNWFGVVVFAVGLSS